MEKHSSKSNKIRPWQSHWPQNTSSTAHLDPKKFARAAGGSKGAQPNQENFVDGTKVARIDSMARFLNELRE